MPKIIDLYKVVTDLSYDTFNVFNAYISDASPFDSYDNIDYYLAHSSEKFLSRFVQNIMKVYNVDSLDDLTSTELDLIFKTIGSKYSNKWSRLYQALVVTEYEPDENYNMVEVMSANGGFSTETATQILNQIVKNKFNQTETTHLDESSAESLNQIVKNKFNQTETHHIDETKSDTLNQIEKHKFNQTETSHIDQKTTDKKDETKTINNNTYGFNSATAVATGGGTENVVTGNNGNTSETKTGNSGNRTILSTTGDGNTVETQTVGTGNQSHTTTGNLGNRTIISTTGDGNTVETLTQGNGNVTQHTTGAQGNRVILTTTGDGNTVETLTQGDGNVNTITREQTPYKLTRSGNIGVTTNQQMITQEIELRENLFKEIVYRDVDSMLTSSIYFY